jgi:hypothetical protein
VWGSGVAIGVVAGCYVICVVAECYRSFVAWFVASSLGLLLVAIGSSSLGAWVLLGQAAGELAGHSGMREVHSPAHMT